MPTIYEIRRDNLRTIVEQRGATSVAKACGYQGPSYISQMAGKNPTRPITEDNARKFEKGLGLDLYWLDQERDSFGNPIGRQNSPPPVSVVPTAEKPVEREIPLTMLDMDRFTRCAAMVKSAAERDKISMSQATFTEITSLAYDDFSRDGDALQAYIERLIRLSK